MLRWLTLLFRNYFSVACSAVWQCFTHSQISFKTGVSSLKPCCSCINWAYGIFWMLCCHVNSLHSIFTRSRVCFKKPLSLLIHKKELLICSGFIMRLKQFSHICQATLLLFCSFYHSCSYFLHQSFEPLKVVYKGWNPFLPNSCYCWYLDLFPWVMCVLSGF